jgi:tetratricopeptide (TPR) repeat protein
VGRPSPARLTLLRAEAGLSLELGDSTTAVAQLERAQALAADEASPESRIEILCDLADAEVHASHFDLAQRAARRALALATEQLGPRHPRTVDAQIRLVQALAAAEKIEETLPLIDQAQDTLEAVYGHEHVTVADLEHAHGVIERIRGDDEAALAHLREGLRIRQAKLDPMHPRLADSHNTIGVALAAIGHHDEARVHHDRALEIRRAVYGERHPLLARTLTNRALALSNSGAFAEAERDLREALAIREATLEPDHIDLAFSCEALGNLLRERLRLDEAEPLLRRALQIRADALGSEHASVAKTAGNLALLELQRERWSEARSLCEQALHAKLATLGPDHPSLVYTYNCLGIARLGEGEAAEAIAPLQEAERLLQARPDHDGLWGETSFALARAIAESGGSRREALVLARRARERYVRLGEARRANVEEIDAWIASRGARP